MNFAGILAGGKGTRMGKTDLPKQFLMLGEKPILIHTLEQFIIADKIDHIVVAVPENWINYTKDIIDKYCNDDRISVIQGGQNRNETIFNICTIFFAFFYIILDNPLSNKRSYSIMSNNYIFFFFTRSKGYN